MPLSAGGRLQEQVDHVLNLIRGCVIRQPIRAVLVAAAGGAALTALLGAWIHRENN
jgi:ABC-type transporter Mla maintaining outer membrane lipid asymmetry permease subunit MlaE